MLRLSILGLALRFAHPRQGAPDTSLGELRPDKLANQGRVGADHPSPFARAATVFCEALYAQAVFRYGRSA